MLGVQRTSISPIGQSAGHDPVRPRTIEVIDVDALQEGICDCDEPYGAARTRSCRSLCYGNAMAKTNCVLLGNHSLAPA
jgi:hypothetical protein